MYGHDYENTRSNPEERWIDRASVKTLVKKWSWDGGPVTSTPTIRGDTVYFGTWKASLVAASALDGTVRWENQVQPNNTINQINNSMFLTEDTVFAGGMLAELFAVNRATGTNTWPSPLVLDSTPELMLWSSPVVVGDQLFLGLGSFQVFLPAQPIFRGSVVGVDLKSKTVGWQTHMTDVAGVSVWSSPTIDEKLGLLIIGTGQPYLRSPESPMSDSLVALDYRTGKVVWSRQFTKNDAFQLFGELGLDHDVGATPNLFEVDGRPLVGVGDKAGNYYALDRATGANVWSRALTPGGANGGVMASAAYHGGTIYVASNDGTSGGTEGAGFGPKVGRTFALDAKNGSSRWEVPMTPGTFGGLAYANGVVFVPTLDGKLHAFDAADGTELWSVTVGQPIGGGVTISGGMVFVGHGWAWLPTPGMQGGLVAYGLP